MALVSDRFRFIFVHNLRTGGTSLTKALVKAHLSKQRSPGDYQRMKKKLQVGEKHSTLLEVKRLIPENKFNSFYKFVFVRNPWDRVYSTYKTHIRKGNSRKLTTLNEAILNGKIGHGNQLHFFMDSYHEINFANRIARFENLHEEWDYIFQLLRIPKTEIPHINQNKYAVSYRDAYTPESAGIIAKNWAEEIKLLNYEF